MNTSNSIVDTVALSLLHFLWQGALIAALAGTLMLVVRKPSARYLIGVGALATMLVSFVATIFLLGGADRALELLTARVPAAALASPTVAIGTSFSMLWTSQAATASNVFEWMTRAWFAGVLVLALRIVLGLLAIERLRRRSLLALPARLVSRFEVLQARLGIERFIRYCRCEAVSVPAVIGMFRPIVLLPMRALTGLSAAQLEAVIAHELGHVQRFDVAVNFLQVIAETLLFFHPAVWWLNRRIRADREDCCDDIAVAASGNRLTYARALAAMEGWRETPGFAMAATGGTVAGRVARLLGISRRGHGERATRAFVAMLVLAATLAAGTLTLSFARPAVAEPAPSRVAEPAVPALDVSPPDPPVPAPDVVPPVPAVPILVPDLEAAAPAPPRPTVAPPALPVPAVAPPEPPRAAKSAKDPKPAKTPKTPKAAKEPKVAKLPKPAKPPKTSRELGVDLEQRVDTRVDVQTHVQTNLNADIHEEVEVHFVEAHDQARNLNRNLDQNHNRESTISLTRDAGSPDRDMTMKALRVSPDYPGALIDAGIKAGFDEAFRTRAMDIEPQAIEHALQPRLKDLTVGKLNQLESIGAL